MLRVTLVRFLWLDVVRACCQLTTWESTHERGLLSIDNNSLGASASPGADTRSISEGWKHNRVKSEEPLRRNSERIVAGNRACQQLFQQTREAF